jgi:parallel beta-helix repeat protein
MVLNRWYSLVLVLFALALLWSAAPLQSVKAAGTTYYVSTTGNNNWAGTSTGTAWRNVNYAASRAQAGDTVIILAGTYNERVQVQNSGTAGNPITFKANPGATVTIDGTGINVPVNYEDGLFEIVGKSYIVVEGLRVINSSYVGIVVRGPNAANITIRNNYVSDTASSGISAWGRVNAGQYNGVTDLLIEGNEINRAMLNGYQEQLSVAEGVEDFIVRNNFLHDGGMGKNPGGPIGIDIKFGVRNGEVYDNIVTEAANASHGIYIDGYDRVVSNVRVYNNLVYNNTYSGIQVNSEEIGGSVDDIEIFNNIAYGNGVVGIRLANGPGPLTNIKIVNNTVYGNGGGIRVETQSITGTIRNNIVSQNTNFQIRMGFVDCNTLMVVRNNLVDGFRNATCEIYGTNVVTNSPQFVNAASYNFELQSTSPALNAATAVGAPSFDYDYDLRPSNGGFDIGAYERP